MATHPNILIWRIPGTEVPGGLLSMGLHRVGHDWSELAAKSLLMRVKEESEKACLKLNVQKTKIIASGPITSWQTDGATMETVTDFNFLDSRITVNPDCNQKIKKKNKSLLLGRKAMINLDSIFKSRDIICQQISI